MSSATSEHPAGHHRAHRRYPAVRGGDDQGGAGGGEPGRRRAHGCRGSVAGPSGSRKLARLIDGAARTLSSSARSSGASRPGCRVANSFARRLSDSHGLGWRHGTRSTCWANLTSDARNPSPNRAFPFGPGMEGMRQQPTFNRTPGPHHDLRRRRAWIRPVSPNSVSGQASPHLLQGVANPVDVAQ